MDALQQDLEGDPQTAEVEQDFGELNHFDMTLADSDPDASAPPLPPPEENPLNGGSGYMTLLASPRRDLLGESDTENFSDGASTVSVDGVVVELSEPEVAVPEFRVTSQAIRDAFMGLDLSIVFSRRAAVMKTIPNFLRGSYRSAMRVAMEEALHPLQARRTLGWKLFLLLTRMLLHRPPRGGNIPKSKLAQRFDDFSGGSWARLLEASGHCDEHATVAQHRKRRRHRPEDERRAARALSLVQMGELSAGRQALQGAEVVPGNDRTLEMLRDPRKRPPRTRVGDEVPAEILEHMPDVPFQLDEQKFLTNLRNSRRGAAAGPSGMTSDHLRPVFDTLQDARLLYKLGEQFSRAETPDPIVAAIRLGRMTALLKPKEVLEVSWLATSTKARQMSDVVEAATAPYQYALSTRAGTECIAHALQLLTEGNPRATVLSIDGLGAFDLISRKSMLEALMRVDGGPAIRPFVRMFYVQPSSYLWEGDDGTVHHIEQGQGGEQGDPLMPLLFALGQHAALCAIDNSLGVDDRLMAFLDDVYVVTLPESLRGDLLSFFYLGQSYLGQVPLRPISFSTQASPI